MKTMKTINKFRMSIILAACTVNFISAQDTKTILGVDAGVSIPLTTDMSGMKLNNGLYWGLDGSYFVTNNVGVSASFSHQGYGVNNIIGSYFLSSGYASVYNTQYQDNVKRTHFLVGPCFAIGLGKITIDLKPTIGVVYNSLPGVITTFTNYDSYARPLPTTYYIIQKSNLTQLAYGGSVAMRIALTEVFSLRFFTSYIGSSGYSFFNTGAGLTYTIKK